MAAIEERIVERHVLKLLRAMLRARVMRERSVTCSDAGTPQGGVLDRCWQQGGQGVLVRYADDRVPPTPIERSMYLRCWEGLVFFAFALDAFSRKLVGWQLAAHMRTTLVLDAPRMALGTRGPGADAQLVHHSDRGSSPDSTGPRNSVSVR